MIIQKSAETKLLLTVERIDYSKAAAYADSPTYHRLEDYYKLPEGAYYVTRNGKIDKNFIDWRNWNVLFMEESRRGVLVSFTFDVCLLTHWKRTTMRRCSS